MLTSSLPLALTMWVNPVWELGVGFAAIALLLTIVYFTCRVLIPKSASLVEEVTIGGLGQPIFYVCLLPAVLTLVALPWALGRSEAAEGTMLPELTEAHQALANRAMIWSGVFLLSLFAVFAAIRLIFPKIAAIAITTAKETMSQLLYWVLLGLGAILIVAAIWIPYNTFGEDHKMYKDLGLTVIMLLALFQALWTASVSISEDVEGKTGLTVLSKPISRWQFVLGKYTGLLIPALLMFFVLGMIFLVGLSYKIGVYDAAESGVANTMNEGIIRLNVLFTIPALALAFLEVMVLSSIAVTISTRLPMAANLAICASIYVLGHMTPMIVDSSYGDVEIVEFFSRLIATVLPVLDHFKVDAAIAATGEVPFFYLATSAGYALIYCTFSLLLALILFEKRDLA